MFWNIFSVENTKILKRRMFWIELAILAVLIIFLYTIVYVTLQTSQEYAIGSDARQELLNVIAWPQALLTSLSFANGSSLGGLLLIVLVGAVTAQEYTWRTMQLWLSRGLKRSVLMLAKFAALLAPILLIVMIPLLVGGGLSAIFSLQLDKSLPIGQINWWRMLMSVLRTACTLLPYAAMGFMLAIVTRSTAATLGIGIAYTLLVEGLASTIFTMLGGILRDIAVYLPGSLADGLLTLNQSALAGKLVSTGGTASTIKYLDPVPAAIGIAVWTAFFLAVAVWSFRRQDLSD